MTDRMLDAFVRESDVAALAQTLRELADAVDADRGHSGHSASLLTRTMRRAAVLLERLQQDRGFLQSWIENEAGAARAENEQRLTAERERGVALDRVRQLEKALRAVGEERS